MTDSVRFGGEEIDGKFRFELTGGDLALDFVNTLDERRGGERELLSSYARLLQWSAQVGAISKQSEQELASLASCNPDEATAVTNRGRKLRETLFSLFSEVVDVREANEGLVQDFADWISEADKKRRLLQSPRGFEWVYVDQPLELAAMFWPIIHSATHLLTDHERATRIKLCEGEGCAWAFVDMSPQRNRRWCDMTVCGNRAKVKRHRSKSRAQSDPGSKSSKDDA